MRLLFLLLFALISLGVAQADESSLDQLLIKADNVKTADFSEFKRLLDEINSRQNTLNQEQSFYYDFLKGFRRAFEGDIQAALVTYYNVYDDTQNINLKVKALSAAINIYAVTRNASEGFKQAYTLLGLVENATEENRLLALSILGIFYNQVDEYALAERMSSQVLASDTTKRTRCYALNIRSEALLNLGKLKLGPELEEAISSCKEIEEFIPASMTLLYKATLMAENGDIASAIAMLEGAKPLFEKAAYPVSFSFYYASLASWYSQLGDAKNALDNAERSLQFASGTGHTKPKITAYKILAKHNEEKGELAKALGYYKQYADNERALLDETKARKLAIQQVKNDALEKENQIRILDKQNNLLKTQAQLRNEELENSRLVITVLLLLGAIIVVWILVTRRMHKKLRVQAQTDNLTGIANRHYFTMLANSNLRYHEKTQQSLSFIIFDLDLFKRINDDYGHLIGDWALKAVVDAIKSVCRAQDIVGRMGGEEFAVLLPGCDVRRGEVIAEDCRRAVAAIDTSASGASFSITASFGVTDTTQCGYQFDELYAKADTALYRSKHEGRNQVFVFHPMFSEIASTPTPAATT